MTDDKVVLVVEDDPLTREVLQYLLETEGYAVTTACDGAEALARLQEGPRPDCVLLDLGMPRFDGRQFLATRSISPALASIPVVVVSGQPRAAEDAALLGASDYLSKPASIEALLSAVQCCQAN